MKMKVRMGKNGRMGSMIKLNWEFKQEYGTWETSVLAQDHNGRGCYQISLIPRPHYCDRGRWYCLVQAIGIQDLDDQEGFGRYYFRLENAKQEMELWINARDECRRES